MLQQISIDDHFTLKGAFYDSRFFKFLLNDFLNDIYYMIMYLLCAFTQHKK